MRDLPATIEPPTIQKLDPDSSPIMLYAVSAKRPTIDVTSIVENEVQEKLQTVTGVGDVIVYGGRRREIHIYANPDRLRAYNLTVSDVAQALRAQNMELPAGRIDAGGQELSIRALGRIAQAGQFSDLVIKTVNGYPIRVRDIGRAEETGIEPRTAAKLDGEQAVVVAVRKQSGTNIGGSPPPSRPEWRSRRRCCRKTSPSALFAISLSSLKRRCSLSRSIAGGLFAGPWCSYSSGTCARPSSQPSPFPPRSSARSRSWRLWTSASTR
jgi:hypothetical protein